MIASRPAQAMRGGVVLIVLAVSLRVPTIEHEFAAALATFTPPNPELTTVDTSVALANRWPGVPLVPAALVRHPSWQRTARIGRLKTSPAKNSGVALMPQRLFVVAADAAAVRSSLATSKETPDRPTSMTAFDLATAAYARLAAGDRRGAVRLFDAALDLGDPRSVPWRTQRDALTRHWSANAYSIVRANGSSGLTVTPVLGGGQSGGGVAYALDPLASRPLALTLRGSIAHADGGRTAFAAVGAQWRPLPGVTIAAERLIGLGPAARDEWTARIAVGSDNHIHRIDVATYAESGIIGTAVYAAGQARIGPEVRLGAIALIPSVGSWASVQRDHDHTIDRLDLGPGVAARAGPLAAALDYRFRVAGNAAPGSGPVVTLSAAF